LATKGANHEALAEEYHASVSSVLPVCVRCTQCGAGIELDSDAVDCIGSSLCECCRFRVMDPFRAVRDDDDILHMERLSQAPHTFVLSVPDLRKWRKSGHEVEVRMLRRTAALGDRQPLHMAWPRFMEFWVNSSKVLRVKPPVRFHKRRDVPQNVSAFLRQGDNEFKLVIDDECLSDYVIGVVRTFSKPHRGLKEHAKHVELSTCKDRICELLSARPSTHGIAGGADGVDCVGDERLKLVCPISLARPTSPPVRGDACRHFQCFDLEAYLLSNHRTKAFNSRWRCPICNLTLMPQDLCIDSFVSSLLAATAPSVDEVLLAPDGTWRLPEGAPELDSVFPAAAAEVSDAEAAEPPPRLKRRSKDIAGREGRRKKRRKATDASRRKERRPPKPRRGPPQQPRVAVAPRAGRLRKRVPVPPPKHAIALDSDASAEVLSDSG